MARDPINAAGGIVIRGGARPRIGVVRRSKDDHWVLPRGKLKRDENPIAGAKREVVEETGHRVRVREFLGAITYSARGRPKLVQFWRMLAAERPSYELTEDITEVRWLPLSAAIRRLSFPLEKLFLRSVGRALRRRRQRRKPRRKSLGKSLGKSSAKSSGKSSRKSARGVTRVQRAGTRKKKPAKRSRKTRHRVAHRATPAAPRHPVAAAPAHTEAAPTVTTQSAAVPHSLFRRLLGRAATVH
jgi:8-oxo-dGTP diphosphatase